MNKNRYDTLLFDLDGTLTDSAPGVMNSFHHALTSYGIEPATHEELKKVVGPPLRYSFSVFYGVPEERYDDIMKYYLEYYLPKGIYENSVYPGVPEMLGRLKEAGYRLIVASSKWQKGVDIVMDHFGLSQYFDFMGGSEVSVGRVDKSDVIRWIIDTAPITDLTGTLMVGDRMYDVEGAAAFGIKTAGVLWGYGTKEELDRAGAVMTARTPEDLCGLLL